MAKLAPRQPAPSGWLMVLSDFLELGIAAIARSGYTSGLVDLFAGLPDEAVVGVYRAVNDAILGYPLPPITRRDVLERLDGAFAIVALHRRSEPLSRGLAMAQAQRDALLWRALSAPHAPHAPPHVP
jgi:hypothetical protein